MVPTSDATKRIAELISAAYSKASKLGLLVGSVSRRAHSSSSDSASRVFVEVVQQAYYDNVNSFDVGNYLVAVDIRTLKAVGLRITSVRRSDIASEIPTPLAVSLGVSPEGLLAPIVVEAVPLLDEDGLPYLAPIEPQSPVVLPEDPSLVSRIAGLPEEGVVLGHLHTGASSVAGGRIAVRLPLREFFKHVLVIGTTGSGKTTFIKNTIWYLRRNFPEVYVLVVDAAGDYAQAVLPPVRRPQDSQVYGNVGELGLRRATVLLPIPRDVKSLEHVARRYVVERVSSVARAYHGVEPEVRVEVSSVRGTPVARVTIGLGDYGEAEISVVPIALSYQQVGAHLEALPVFSRQAKIFLRHIVDYIEQEEGGVRNFTHLSTAFTSRRRELERNLKIHRSTLDNIERVLNFIASSECVDTYLEGVPVGIPDPELLSENFESPVIVDLDYATTQGLHFLIANLLAYEVLRSLYEWKKSGGALTRPTIVVLDEAHRFFPSEGTSAEEVEMLADFIARIARLGRARGLGIVFSTHSPKDVHRIVIQLSNTKLIFRSEREYLEMLDVPSEYIRVLELAPDRVALLKSHVIRSGYALLKTSEPLLGHFDTSTLLTLRASTGPRG